MTTDADNDQQTPQWLTDIQNNSWEPEIILSGLTITFLFLMADPLYNFFAMLLQEHNIAKMSMLGYTLSVLVLNTVIVVLILYLLLRGLWVGMIGLSYTYPDGVVNHKLRKFRRHMYFHKPIEWVQTLETWCSLFFSAIYSAILSLVLVVIAYSPLVLLEILVDSTTAFDIGMTIYVAIWVIPAILLATIYKRSALSEMFGTNILNNITFTHTTNLGLVRIYGFFAALSIFVLPLSTPEYSQFDRMRDQHKASKAQNPGLAMIHPEHYTNTRNDNRRVAKVVTAKMDVDGPYLDIFLAYFKADKNIVKHLLDTDKSIAPTINLDAIKSIGHTALYQIQIDGKIITDATWLESQYGSFGQKGYTVRIPLKDLPKGQHRLCIHKAKWLRDEQRYDWLQNWDSLIFYRL